MRQHCVYWPAMLMSAGVELPKGWAIGGWLLSGGEKMSKTSGNVVNPLDLIDDVGLDGFRYYVLADTAYGNDGDFTRRRRSSSRYNSDLANNLGNLLARVATVVGKKCDGIGTAPDPDSPLATAAATAYTDTAAQWDDRAAEPGARRHLDADPRHERPSRDERTVEVRPGPRRRPRDGRCTRGAADRRHPRSPAIPDTAQTIWERIGLPGNVVDQRLPDAAAWGQYPAGAPVDEGRRPLPAHHG